jgi:hypothetical protein
MTIKHMHRHHLEGVLECERLTHSFKDPEFEVPQLPSHAWGKQRFETELAGDQCRGLVFLEKDVFVLGGLVYRLDEDAYHVLLLTSRPTAGYAREKLVDELERRASLSKNRKRVRVSVPLADARTTRFFKERKYDVEPAEAARPGRASDN